MCDSQLDVLVVGAGVVGLTTGVCLAEAGLRVGIRTADPPEETTSAAAGAVWGPVRCGPPSRVRAWAGIGLSALRDLARVPGAGVRILAGMEVSRVPADPPWWSDLLPDVRRCDPAELPVGFTTGWRYTAPVVDMPVYLGWLRDRFVAAGGRLQVSPVRSLTEALSEAAVVVNCTGIAARDLVPDATMVPVRGQVVVAVNPGIERFYIDHSPTPPDVIYMFPHGDTIVLGGTYDEGDEDRQVRPQIAERIVRDCAAVDPRLRDVEILTHRVGLRPSRPQVRLDCETLPDGRLLWHNYGHGGAGVTLSWGCAQEITEAIVHGRRRPASTSVPQ